MAAYIQRLHHISLHVSNADKIASELVSKFKFHLFAARLGDKSRQFAFRKGAAVFVVNERLKDANAPLNERFLPRFGDVQAGKLCQERCLYDVHPCYAVDTVSNVCFEVENVERSFKTLRHLGCGFLVPPTTVRDDGGAVTYSVVKSVVGNVCHTLIDKSGYEGSFLPGFEVIREEKNNDDDAEEEDCSVSHFDHITYACPRRFTHSVMEWYEKMFGFKRFFIGSNEDPVEGFVLDQEGIGLRLTAMEYWKCSKAGVALPSVDGKEADCKFVIAESLPEQGHNQVDTFLEQHRGPGIQHIGLYTRDIVSTAQTMAESGVRFFSPPPAYYTEVGKQQEILEAGHSPELLSRHGILLDTDLQQGTTQTAAGRERRYLLQVFTRPLFAEDTFFLELIERRGASGFGEGNIRALWRSVQSYMENEENPPPKTLQSTQT